MELRAVLRILDKEINIIEIKDDITGDIYKVDIEYIRNNRVYQGLKCTDAYTVPINDGIGLLIYADCRILEV